MAVPLNASMPAGLDLGPGFTVRVTALDTSTGAVVSGVKVNELEIEVGGKGTVDLGSLEYGPWFLVPGPEA